MVVGLVCRRPDWSPSVGSFAGPLRSVVGSGAFGHITDLDVWLQSPTHLVIAFDNLSFLSTCLKIKILNQAEGGRIWPPLLCNLVCQGRTTDYVVRLEKGELGPSFYNLDEFERHQSGGVAVPDSEQNNLLTQVIDGEDGFKEIAQ